MKEKMSNKTIFSSVGVLSNIFIFFALSVMSGLHEISANSILIFIMSLILFCTIYVLLHLIISMVMDEDPGNINLFPSFFLTLNLKKINYFDLNDFYVSVDIKKGSNKVTIWKQEKLFLKKIDYIKTSSKSIDSIKLDLKKSINEFMKKESEMNSFKNSVKNWQGDLDKPSKRDNIISKILK